LDFNGKVFKETLSKHVIKKFRGTKHITALDVFLLEYHSSKKHIRTHLAKYGRIFLSIINIQLCKYKGKAFYIKREQVVKIFIKSQVVVDAAYF
jgi:hypothetical protein